MCLVTRQIKPITTKKDLVVFKDVKTSDQYDNVKTSHYFFFIWEKGVVNKTEFGIEKQYPFDSPKNKGVCVANPYFDRKSRNFYQKDTRKHTVIKEGFHAVLTKKRMIKPRYSKVAFLIPKGSLIFKDATGLIVSNQMMLL
jgi:hypothetical protein